MGALSYSSRCFFSVTCLIALSFFNPEPFFMAHPPLYLFVVVCVQSRVPPQNYDTFVTLLAELQVLREADVFIGTFSSNIGRLMMLLREANGFPRDTTRSVHVPEWFPGRRLLL